MAYMCVKRDRECDGCMDCAPHYYCPVCGEEISETVYVSEDGEVVGCDNCVEAKEPQEVLDEAD